ncbi:helix-turn-helix transcriptional regulator [Methylobacterium iners]
MTTHPLREYREAESLSLDAIAALVGRSKASISRIETGDQQPSPELARAIRDVTGIPLWKLRPDLWDAPETPQPERAA